LGWLAAAYPQSTDADDLDTPLKNYSHIIAVTVAKLSADALRQPPETLAENLQQAGGRLAKVAI